MEHITKGLSNDRLFGYFEDIAAIPHPSGHEEGVADFVCDQAKKHGLQYCRDDSNNVIVYVPATPDRADREPVILQGHLDMVFVADDAHASKDPLSPITLKLEDWILSAEGTSLGGDDGVAVAIMLTIMDGTDTPHPPLELVFTTGEEVGLIGASRLDVSKLKGRMMLNLDSDAEGIGTVGCAGGRRIDLVRNCEPLKNEADALSVTVDGLKGGHSGADIDLGKSNANKLMGQLLYEAKKSAGLAVCGMRGGTVDNAIPDSCRAVITGDDLPKLQAAIESAANAILRDVRIIDQDAKVTVTKTRCGSTLPGDVSDALVDFLFLCPDGPHQRMPGDRNTLLSSSNLAITDVSDGKIKISLSVRSPQKAAKLLISDRISRLGKLLGFDASYRGDYPGWYPKADSVTAKLYAEEFKKQTGRDAVCVSIHAGLECGIFADQIEGFDAVSFGPDNQFIHSPKEMMDLRSFDRTYRLVLNILERF